jgi:hypothetical protein
MIATLADRLQSAAINLDGLNRAVFQREFGVARYSRGELDCFPCIDGKEPTALRLASSDCGKAVGDLLFTLGRVAEPIEDRP